MNQESIQYGIIKIIKKHLPKINNTDIDIRFESHGNRVGPIKIEEKENPYRPSSIFGGFRFLRIELNTDNQLIKDLFSKIEETDFNNELDSIQYQIEKREYDVELPRRGNMPYEVELWYERGADKARTEIELYKINAIVCYLNLYQIAQFLIKS